jgi:hypothetical protein
MLRDLYDRMMPVFPDPLARALLGGGWLLHQAKIHLLGILQALSPLVRCGGNATDYPQGAYRAWKDEELKALAAGREAAFRQVVWTITDPELFAGRGRQGSPWLAVFLVLTQGGHEEVRSRREEWWAVLTKQPAIAPCADPWLMEYFLLRPELVLVEDAQMLPASAIDALFSRALTGFGLADRNPDIEDQIVRPLCERLKKRVDADRWHDFYTIEPETVTQE